MESHSSGSSQKSPVGSGADGCGKPRRPAIQRGGTLDETLRRAIWFRALATAPLRTMGRFFAYVTAELRLRWEPAVPWVAILGSDGSGKSSVVKEMAQRYAACPYAGLKAFHWRPRIVARTRGAELVTEPHAKPSRGPVWSAVSLAVLVSDWLLGYWTRLVHLRAKGYILAFDRIYFDLVVDPRRYRYGAGARLARMSWMFLPKPDLVFFLDSPVDVLWIRKQEVTRAELERQRELYTRLVQQLPGGHIIDGTQPVHLVVMRSRMLSAPGWSTGRRQASPPHNRRWGCPSPQRGLVRHDRALDNSAVIAPRWYDSLLFLALMSGPPKFRERDAVASLAGEIDLVVLIQIAVWTCGGLWVLMRLYPTVLKRGAVPGINRAQVAAALLIGGLSLSLRDSPGMLLTAFTLGQFAVMVLFVWVFTHRFGASASVRHIFFGVAILALATGAAVYLAPDLVTDESARVRGDYIADTGIIAVIGMVLCLCDVPRLKRPAFWAAIALFGALLAASRTRSAYAAFLLFLPLGFTYGRRLPVRNLYLPLAALTLSVFLFDALSSTTNYLVRERESVETMSDRIPLWQHLTATVMRRAPVTGLGYYAASRVVATEYNPGLGNAHSAFFEVLVGGGVVGATLYVFLCATLISFAFRLLQIANGDPSSVAAVGLLTVAILMGVTTSAAVQAGPLGFAFWSQTAILPALYREMAQNRGLGELRLRRADRQKMRGRVALGYAANNR